MGVQSRRLSGIEKRKALDLLEKSIQTVTVNPPGDEAGFARLLAGYVDQSRLKIEFQKLDTNRSNICITLPGKSKGRIILNGHLDTVPFGDLEKWDSPPDDAKMIAGRLYGRGASDMKSGVCALLVALDLAARDGLVLQQDFVFLGTADEEAGGLGALAYAKADGLKNVSGMIIAEPTGNRIGVASLGCIWIKAKVYGKSAHAAYPSYGENAIDGLFCLRNAILRILGQEEHSLLGKSTCQLTTIQGGTKVNMIPDFAEGIFDIRTIPSLDQEELMKKIKASVQVLEEGNKNLQFDLSIINQRSSVSIENENSLINRLNDAHQSVFGIPGQITGTRFFSDASVFQQFEGIPTVLYGPGDSEQAHQANESLDIEAYYKGIEVFYSFIKGFSIQ